MEELDQSSLHPLLEHLKTNICLGLNRTRVTCVAGEQSSKELFKQLVYLLLGTTICAGIFALLLSRRFSPRHMAFQYMCSLKTYSHKGWIVYSLTIQKHTTWSQAITSGSPLWRNLTRVLSILYLSTSRQTCVSARNQTWASCIAGEHFRKELCEQLVYLLLGTNICAGIFTHVLRRLFFATQQRIAITWKPK